jgi:sarcosine oxidase, subunit delta
MKIMNCPLNGPRNITEFIWGGDVKTMPDPDTCSDEAWADYLFLEDNVAGEVDEWWLHAPSNTWFVARRNTLTDEILWTKAVDDYFSAEKMISQSGVAPASKGSSGGQM